MIFSMNFSIKMINNSETGCCSQFFKISLETLIKFLLNRNVYCVFFFGIIWIKNNLRVGIDEGWSIKFIIFHWDWKSNLFSFFLVNFKIFFFFFFELKIGFFSRIDQNRNVYCVFFFFSSFIWKVFWNWDYRSRVYFWN